MFNNKIKAINPVEYAKGIVANEKIRFEDSNNEKKYFAKYLPVEGEIQEGDTFLEHGISYRLLHKRDTECIICTLNLEKQFSAVCRNPVKSKLFLCSRDIQIGDTNLQHYDPLTNTKCADEPRSIKNEEDLLYLKDYIENVERYDCFKVLGEISPEATWVKEGDVFNDDEVCIIYLNPPIEGVVYANKIRQFMGIKGPCGHFH